MKYNAFISYSHSKDSNLAPGLEKAFEKFAKPVFRRTALTIFRDTNDLSASPDLWGNIEAGLRQSDYFIFLASPQAASSHWCKKEIDFWKAHKPVDHILIALTEGEMVWDESVNDFDWSLTTALPHNLSGVFKNEPLYVDFRDCTTDTRLTLDNPVFREKVVLFAATLHGKTVADMTGESIRQHKRTIRIRNSAIIILSFLLIASIVLTMYAFQQKGEAQKQTKIAVKNENTALANSYLSSSNANLTNDPTVSLRLAEYAYKFAKSQSLDMQNYEDQLIQAYYNPYNFYVSNGVQLDKDTLIPLHEFNNLRLEMQDSAAPLYMINGNKFLIQSAEQYITTPVYFYTFSPKGKFIIANFDTVGGGNSGTRETTAIYDLEAKVVAQVGTYVSFGTDERHNKNRVKFDAAETRFVISGETPGASVYDIQSGQTKKLLLSGESTDILDVGISKKGEQVALAHRQGFVDLINLSKEGLDIESRWELRGHNRGPVELIKYSADGLHLFTQSAGIKRKWSVANTINNRCVQIGHTPSMDDTLLTVTGENSLLRFSEINATGEPEETIRESRSYRVAYLSKQGDTIAVFDTKYEGDLPDVSKNNTFKKWTSPNGRYFATRNGLFNNRNERLLEYNETRVQYKFDIITIGFSRDSRFFFLVDKIYFLDPEMILSRMNDKVISGDIAQMDSTTRKLYLIK